MIFSLLTINIFYLFMNNIYFGRYYSYRDLVLILNVSVFIIPQSTTLQHAETIHRVLYNPAPGPKAWF